MTKLDEATELGPLALGSSEGLGATADKGVSVVFLDGHTVTVRETSFPRCLVLAAYQRMQAGASMHRELHIDVAKCTLFAA